MQLAPAFNLANIIADSPHNLKEPFKQLQFTNLDNIVSLWRDTGRSKRDTGLVNVDEDDFVEFLDDVADFKGDVTAKMGNLSCVLTELKLLKSWRGARSCSGAPPRWTRRPRTAGSPGPRQSRI